MEHRQFGSLSLSLVGLGCNNFGNRCDERRSAEVVHAALAAGITTFDTADVYSRGVSEEHLGKALGNRRDEVVIATKFANPMDDSGKRQGASARWITEAVEDSLRRLGTDRIDLYQQHVPDDSVDLSETMGALDALVRAGKVREIGHSNFSADQIDEAAAVATEHGFHPFATAQNELSLVRRRAADEVLPACERNGLGMLPYFPLASGLLTGKYRRGEAPPEGTRLASIPEERQEKALSDKRFDLVERLESFAFERGHSLLEL
ncbi:MAG TPA: aldo/keto reductase, partial [Acidimicrobiales bacterium]|nr:aldo/keto reductase [Acidimicrobiales bacterium]